MPDPKTCPKCNGTMTQGRIMKFNEYSARNKYLYIFAPDEDSGPDLSRMFSGNPTSKGRKALVAFACDDCGFTEFYSQAIE